MADLRPIRSGLAQLLKQLQKMTNQHLAKELKRNKRRPQRNGQNLPLSAWMLGTRKDEPSKILAVAAGRAWYPYTTMGGSLYAVAERAMKGKQLTAIQRYMVLNYVLCRYRGRVTDNLSSYWYREHAIDKDVPMDVIHETFDWLGDVPSMPLSLLLSEQLTDILITASLHLTLLKGNLTWKQPNSSRSAMPVASSLKPSLSFARAQ